MCVYGTPPRAYHFDRVHRVVGVNEPIVYEMNMNCPFNVGDNVYLRPHDARCGTRWETGVVSQVLSSTDVELNGDGMPRHVRDVRHRERAPPVNFPVANRAPLENFNLVAPPVDAVHVEQLPVVVEAPGDPLLQAEDIMADAQALFVDPPPRYPTRIRNKTQLYCAGMTCDKTKFFCADMNVSTSVCKCVALANLFHSPPPTSCVCQAVELKFVQIQLEHHQRGEHHRRGGEERQRQRGELEFVQIQQEHHRRGGEERQRQHGDHHQRGAVRRGGGGHAHHGGRQQLCTRCDKRGHRWSECPRRKRRCNTCNVNGHIASECRQQSSPPAVMTVSYASKQPTPQQQQDRETRPQTVMSRPPTPQRIVYDPLLQATPDPTNGNMTDDEVEDFVNDISGVLPSGVLPQSVLDMEM